MVTSQVSYTLVALLVSTFILLFILTWYHKKIKRPILTALFLIVFALLASVLISHVFYGSWMTVLILFVALILSLTAECLGCLGTKGILTINFMASESKTGKWQQKYPPLFKFQERHTQFYKTFFYGVFCSMFIWAASTTIMQIYKDKWGSLRLRYIITDEVMSHIAQSHIDGMSSPFKSLLLVILIWSVVTLITAFICSLFLRDRDSLRTGIIIVLPFFVLMAPIPVTMFQRFCLALTCDICTYVSSKFWIFNISNKICRLFKSGAETR